MKYFIITVDTEGDNLWDWHKGEPVGTQNTHFIPRFQSLCNEFGFKPVYLTNYEMLCDDEYVAMVRDWQAEGLCEVGLHLHAWNNPPMFELEDVYGGNPYLIEYPDAVMHAKFDILYQMFVEKIGEKPYSHRSGRWAMDERYFKLLQDYDVKVDCSYTPHISWKNVKGATMGGSDYSQVSEHPGMVHGMYEVPVTVRKAHHALRGSVKHRVKTLLQGECLQLRPASYNIEQMKRLVDMVGKETDTDYLEFMIHSSELMPGGSPYFKDEKSVDALFDTMRQLFLYVQSKGYEGTTLKEYHTYHLT